MQTPALTWHKYTDVLYIMYALHIEGNKHAKLLQNKCLCAWITLNIISILNAKPKKHSWGFLFAQLFMGQKAELRHFPRIYNEVNIYF